jgi:hypothetical protein
MKGLSFACKNIMLKKYTKAIKNWTTVIIHIWKPSSPNASCLMKPGISEYIPNIPWNNLDTIGQ